MTRHWFSASVLIALVGGAGWHSPLVRADESAAAYVEEADPSEAVADDSARSESGTYSTASDSDDAASVDDSSTDNGPSDDAVIEVIHERYPNRAVKIEREVAQDDHGNYVNHGSWRMWDPKGVIMIEGQCRNGDREGTWNRWFRTGEVELLTKAPYNQFQGPFISQATFTRGKLDGKWTIYDSKQRKISEWEFADGNRHGHSTWYFPNGHKMREIEYENGEIDGQLLEWNGDSKLVTKETYQHGRKLAQRVENAAGGGKKSEGLYLFAKEVVRTPDDWWNCTLAVYVKQGKDEKHGPWTAWYPNGQKQAEGEYRTDVQVGKFTWWFANGQKSLQGVYEDGEQQGTWTWWHENGQKSIVGDYTKGHPSGKWTWWGTNGKVARSTEMEQGSGEIVRLPERPKQLSASRPETMPPQPQARPLR